MKEIKEALICLLMLQLHDNKLLSKQQEELKNKYLQSTITLLSNSIEKGNVA